MYEYRAVVDRIIDADTFDILIDLGLGVYKTERIRLADIDAYETSLRRGTTPEQKELGLQGKQWCIDNLLDKSIILRTQKDKTGKYGRYIATVYFDDICINDKLVELGFATTKSY